MSTVAPTNSRRRTRRNAISTTREGVRRAIRYLDDRAYQWQVTSRLRSGQNSAQTPKPIARSSSRASSEIISVDHGGVNVKSTSTSSTPGSRVSTSVHC